MESRRERLRKAAARHGAREFSPEPGLPSPTVENRSNRKFFYVASGALLLALVAFVCGVQMGKALSELRWSESGGARLQDRRGDVPPFRFMERGKDPQPASEARLRPPEAGETRKEPPASRQAEKAPRRRPASRPKNHALPFRKKERAPLPKPNTPFRWRPSTTLRRRRIWSTR